MTVGVVEIVSITVWTIGHSTRSGEEFRQVLRHHEIELVVDVRRFPGSRRLPQFSSGALEQDLGAEGVAYHWIPALGGRRRANPASQNRGWRNQSFQAYADHLETDEFAKGLEELLMLASGLRTGADVFGSPLVAMPSTAHRRRAGLPWLPRDAYSHGKGTDASSNCASGENSRR